MGKAETQETEWVPKTRQELFESQPKLVRSEVYPGTAQQFRAQMQRLHNGLTRIWPPEIEEEFLVTQHGGRWESSNGDRLVFREYQAVPADLGYFVPLRHDGLHGDDAALDESEAFVLPVLEAFVE